MKEVNIYRQELDYSANESYKSLRTNLLFCGEDKKVIAVTSCTPNEGKSTVSLNLALSLADSGKKVLFIDADLRKSVLMGRTEVEGEEIKGLSHLLSHQETIENVICATNVPRFHIIYAGIVPPNPAELLGGKYFKRFLSAIRKVYDYVIIDTPPLGSVVDAALIAKTADASVLVISANAVSRRMANSVKEQLINANPNFLGVILNKADEGTKHYGYGKRYGHRYGYGYGYGRYGQNPKE